MYPNPCIKFNHLLKKTRPMKQYVYDLKHPPEVTPPQSWSDSVRAWRWGGSGPPAEAVLSVCSDPVYPG